jgi:membrane fusion protein, multidrug efflux system
MLLFASTALLGCEEEAAASPTPPAARAVPVAAAEVVARDLSRILSVSGRLEPLRTVPVASRGAGVVRTVAVEEGDVVSTGDVVAALDVAEHEAILARAVAARDGARLAYARQQALRAREATTGHAYDTAKAELEIAEADVRLARTQVAFGRITAPLDGVVVARHVEPGAAVAAGGAVVDVADTRALVVRVGVSDLDVPHLEPGQPARLFVDAFDGRQVDGVVRRIFPRLDPATGLVPVEVAVADGDAVARFLPTEAALTEAPLPPLRPGYLVRVHVVVDPRPEALAVPTEAVVSASDDAWVHVIDGDTLVRRRIETGVVRGGWTEVRSGLSAGERIIASGAAELAEGTRVRIAGWSG